MNAPTPRALPVVSPEMAADSGTGTGTALAEPEEELRTSNTVAEFEYSRFRAVVFSLSALAGLPLLPLWPFFLAREAKDWSIARNYFSTMSYCLRTVLTHVRHGSFVRMLKYNLVLGPEKVKQAIDQRRGACTRCAKCCRQYECIFLGQDETTKDFYCKVYQTNYWYYGTCGRYPVDQQDIDDHACPGFSFPSEEAA